MAEAIWSEQDLIEFAGKLGASGVDHVAEMEEVGITKDTMHNFVSYCAVQLVIRGHDFADVMLTVGAALFHLGYKFHEELNKENVSV